MPDRADDARASIVSLKGTEKQPLAPTAVALKRKFSDNGLTSRFELEIERRRHNLFRWPILLSGAGHGQRITPRLQTCNRDQNGDRLAFRRSGRGHFEDGASIRGESAEITAEVRAGRNVDGQRKERSRCRNHYVNGLAARC